VQKSICYSVSIWQQRAKDFHFFSNSSSRTLVCSIKKTIFSWNAYPRLILKNLMYLKRNTKFLPDRWGLKTPPLKVRWTKSFSVHMNVRSNHFVKWIFQKMVKFSYAFFPQKLTNFSICFLLAGNCHNYQICSLLGKKRIANFNHFLNNPLCEVIWPKVHVNRKRFRSMNFERPEES
jgi:hypothetical protein